MSDYHRPLYLKDVTSDFLVKVLDVPISNPNHKKYSEMIVGEESLPMSDNDTLSSRSVRARKYCREEDRDKLRKKIVEEMMEMTRLDNDEQVRLGKGGARPQSKRVNSDRKAFYVMGLPASGKSSICGKLCDLFGAYLLDSDLVKRKLPEYNRRSGASLVHEESSIITMGGYFEEKPFTSLMEHCYQCGYNICLPKIGSNLRSITKVLNVLRECGYNIYMVLVSLDRKLATQRAFNRYLRTKRYVPLSMIFDGYANDPILCYYRLRKYFEDNGNKLFDEMIALSTDVQKGKPLVVLDRSYSGPNLDRYMQTL